MLKTKILRTLLIVGIVVPAAMLVDYLLNVVLMPSPGAYTPISTFFISTILTSVVSFYLVSQQSELVRVRDALTKTSAEFRMLSDNSNDVVIRLNANGDIEYVSPSVSKLLDYQPAELIGRGVLSIVAEEDREGVGDLLARRSRFANGAAVEVQLLRKGGIPIWVEGRPRIVRDARTGELVAVTDVLRDITQRRSFEAALESARAQAEAASEAKSQFLATVSHEIRTPLNGVLGMAQVMSHEPLSPEQAERLAVIRQSGESLLAILNDILDLSKIEAGKLTLEDAPFDLEQIVSGAQEAFSGAARLKGLGFGFAIAPEAAGRYRGDPVRIRQIVYNLVSNALKFTETGEIAVRVAGAPGGVEISVADTGVGIAPDQMDRLFEKFVQGDASTTRRYGGTGLGLAICSELCRAMGARLTATSELGKGSRFVVDLPLRRADAAPAATLAPTAPDTPPAALPSETPLRILAAEDNPTNQLVLKAILEGLGHQFEIVGDGAAAVDAWAGGRWDAVLMDVQMPVMDGPDATRAIRAREAAEGLPATPIIALTANAMNHQVREYLAIGMTAFVSKPINIADLAAAIVAATQRATGREQPLSKTASG